MRMSRLSPTSVVQIDSFKCLPGRTGFVTRPHAHHVFGIPNHRVGFTNADTRACICKTAERA